MNLIAKSPEYTTLWNELFDNWFDPVRSDAGELSPRASVIDSEKSVVVRLELPGVRKEDLKVEVDNGVLTVRASKKSREKIEGKDLYLSEIAYGEYGRSFRLSEELDGGKIDAVFEDGILRLEVAKKESAQPRKIPVA